MSKNESHLRTSTVAQFLLTRNHDLPGTMEGHYVVYSSQVLQHSSSLEKVLGQVIPVIILEWYIVLIGTKSYLAKQYFNVMTM